MRKFKLFLNILKEEQWLNEHLQKGYQCTNVSGVGLYTFKRTDKAHIIRLDYQDYLSADKYKEYKMIYEDFGWTHIRGSRLGSIHYWQKTADSQNEIFSDRQSFVHYYKRLMNYSLSLAFTFLIISYMIYEDSSLYQTQGLWDMEGSLFWKAFLFETPFAIFKAIPLFMILFFGINYYHAYRQYSTLKEK
ncbi:DUF2812 domain-containing protein [Ureibacillus aquaedulcis]|uniref:DUF2812 domain-containing protein n=1 Tax=Ureibacillus aquaedulcis TaxID=3058421 RepID=A0ABT8GNI2_9BACL|nr:DUF2812 domain-containing protein [Ureibacillus sp. BA0131]MDN4492975.1 DUF2812 domain-containing protein [Ureibacillus sp. BA0131]